jgi:hypothetical protein
VEILLRNGANINEVNVRITSFGEIEEVKIERWREGPGIGVFNE